ncbi:hypothetical protein VJ918_08450 [Adlercreutzia sp. R21]|uniref:Uncharacterized protein n=1 Tax=Adlercreutzia wanghongyangiae TaxID=3111451 RepID=A0ABU6IEZ6_9ACTN|nr:hypothetical protein [Adlercreutzia sp. R21]MEC4174966.1 hypothetical protein [Adlercreutzia sp. R7]MEC4184838.1 hypothetical protein [Adlercreutzia sp. R21]
MEISFKGADASRACADIFRVRLRKGLRQRFQVAKRRNKKLPAMGNRALSSERVLLQRQHSGHQNTQPWSIPMSA